jgi:hypothetical protein
MEDVDITQCWVYYCHPDKPKDMAFKGITKIDINESASIWCEAKGGVFKPYPRPHDKNRILPPPDNIGDVLIDPSKVNVTKTSAVLKHRGRGTTCNGVSLTVIQGRDDPCVVESDNC